MYGLAASIEKPLRVGGVSGKYGERLDSSPKLYIALVTGYTAVLVPSRMPLKHARLYTAEHENASSLYGSVICLCPHTRSMW